MLIKKLLANAMAKITGRKCSTCRYNRAGRCAHPAEGMYMKCWQSITKPGHAGKYERTVFTLRVTAAEWDGLLSEEEQHQLQRIKASLQEAGDIARESGLLEG